MVALENMGFVANMVSLVLYFWLKLHFELSDAANTLTNLMGSAFLLSVIGGFISDTYINRFHTCLIFGTVEILVSFFPLFPLKIYFLPALSFIVSPKSR